MNRAEALRRLEDGTSFQFVGDKVLIRSVALIEALRQARTERFDAVVSHEQDVASDAPLILAA
ncbi:MAG TPA: hypothetical protein VFN03_07965 [Trueperaceae bacterium]|nr:hypothetical protein [Trueperaceae bacterium]